MWGVNPQVNWDGRDAFVGACYPVGLCLDFCPHFIKIHKLLPFAVQKFSIFYTQGQRDRHKGRVEKRERTTTTTKKRVGEGYKTNKLN